MMREQSGQNGENVHFGRFVASAMQEFVCLDRERIGQRVDALQVFHRQKFLSFVLPTEIFIWRENVLERRVLQQARRSINDTRCLLGCDLRGITLRVDVITQVTNGFDVKLVFLWLHLAARGDAEGCIERVPYGFVRRDAAAAIQNFFVYNLPVGSCHFVVNSVSSVATA